MTSPTNRNQAIEAALRGILDAGTWYTSALEIDNRRGPVGGGFTLEEMGRAALALPEREPPHCPSCSCGLEDKP